MADKTINVRHVQKHDTENNWSSKNPVLLAGEMAFTTDGTNAGKYKLGDGTSKWSALSYAKAKLEKSDVTTALGYTPPTTNTTYSTGTASTSGLTKLYTSTGSATDGTMTQAAINTALSGKASSSHTHTKSQITDFPTSLPANGGNASTANKLTTARSISLGSGASGSVNFDGSGNVTLPVNSVSEAYLSWGGKNFSGSYGCIDAAMISELGANRLAFGSGEGISVEYSRDSGSTWTDYGLPAGSRSSILSTGYNTYIGKADSSNKATAAYMLRITLDTDKIPVYTQLNKFAIYLSTSGCNGCYCSIDASLEATPTKWVNFANKVDVSGWSGWNIINTKTITTYGNSSSVQYGLIRFTFGCTSGSTNYTGLNISKIMGFGGVGWGTPSNMAANGHLYSYDSYQNATFPGTVTAKSFNGTATKATTAENVTGVEASANVDRHVWFSDGGSETVRGYDDNFKYNPTTKLLSTNISGNASTASKLGTGTTGSSTQPVYFTGGKPTACSYTLGKSVPSNAVFTDTNTWRPLGTTADTACAGNDSRLSDARPASDVSAWAKASSKPSYSKGEVGLGNVDNTADNAKSVKYATSAGSATSSTKITNAGHIDSVDKLNNSAMEANTFKYATIASLSGLDGWDNNDGIVLSASWSSNANYGHQILLDDSGYDIAHRYRNNGTWSPWKRLIDTNNYTSYCAPLSHTHSKSQITDFPTSLPASDVYSWAKASSKPSYTKSEIGLGNVDNTADANKSVKYATSAGSASSATTATKLSTSAGSSTQPIYFSNGTPTACSYTLGKSVPSNAVFTDTTYTVATTSKDGLMSSADKTVLNSVVSRMKRNVFVITDSYGVYKSNSDASGDPMVFPSYFTKVFNFMGFVAHHGGNFNAGASNSADFAAIYKNEAKPKITADLTDLIIVGGFNDREAEPSAIHAGIKRLYDAVIKDYPNCKISIGHFGWSSTPDSKVRDSMLTHSLVAYRACTTDGCAYMPNSEYTMHNYSLFTTDNVHPNTNGKAEIVKQIFEYLCTGTCDVHYPYRLITIPATGNITTAYQVGFKLDNNIVTMYLPNTSLTFKKYPPMGANALSQFMCIASIGSRDTCGYAMGMYDDKYHVQKSLPIKGYFTCSDGTFRPLDPCDFYLQGGFIMCRANILASPTSAYLPDFYATGFQIRGCVIQLTCDQC